MFTEDEIRAVMDTHHPSRYDEEDGEAECACGPAPRLRHRCLYCRGQLKQALSGPPTGHRKDCRRPPFTGAGETEYCAVTFNVLHLIEQLQISRSNPTREGDR